MMWKKELISQVKNQLLSIGFVNNKLGNTIIDYTDVSIVVRKSNIITNNFVIVQGIDTLKITDNISGENYELDNIDKFNKDLIPELVEVMADFVVNSIME